MSWLKKNVEKETAPPSVPASPAAMSPEMAAAVGMALHLHETGAVSDKMAAAIGIALHLHSEGAAAAPVQTRPDEMSAWAAYGRALTMNARTKVFDRIPGR